MKYLALFSAFAAGFCVMGAINALADGNAYGVFVTMAFAALNVAFALSNVRKA